MSIEPTTPPLAERLPQKFEYHDDVFVDEYFWLRDKSNPAVISYLEAENAYTDAMTAHTKALQETLYGEMRTRIKEEDFSVPEKYGEFYYYYRTEVDKQYRIHCRRRGNIDAPEEVLLDENQLAADHEYFRLGIFRVSPDHSLLAYSTDTNGSEKYTIQILDLSTGQLLEDVIPNTDYSAEWANDNRSLFYTELDQTRRPYRLLRHEIGTPCSTDVLIQEEPDERFYMSATKSKSKRYIFINLSSKVTSSVWFLDANNPIAPAQEIQPREEGHIYRVEHQVRNGADAEALDQFLIVTNDNAINSKVMEVPVSTPGKANWQEWLPHRDEVKIESVEAFRDHVVVYQRSEGLKQIWVYDMAGEEGHVIDFSEPVYTTYRSSNLEYNSSVLRFGYTSLTTPYSIYDYEMNQRTRQLMKQQEVLGGYDSTNYVSERLWATAEDGTQIPISLVRHKSTVLDQPVPTLLYGYGSYEASIDPYFSSSRVSLLDRGMLFAIAHIRGGGEMGRNWYENGKFLKKKNTFTDFIDCAEYLIRKGYTTADLLVAEGRSAGGLLMGVVTNLRPDLFKAVIAGVPFVDVINTMMDPSIPLTVMEYDEWGDPNDPVYYDYMKSYSPYDNLAPTCYPNILVTAGLNDPRVQYWEPAKYVAKLRTLKTDDNRLLLKTNMGAGHGGASGRFDYLKEIAFDYAFVLDVLGLAEKKSPSLEWREERED